jgi:hypothetical protein
MYNHDILFLDLLGFAHAMQHWSEQRIEEVISLLRVMAEQQSDFDFNVTQQESGYQVTARAALTVFSDHLVASFPRPGRPEGLSDDVWKVVSEVWDDHVRQQMQRITARLAKKALHIGLLVRGGISRGRLYHQGRVVAGEALVDAYRLESEVAKLPRVVISPRLQGDNRFFVDGDGGRCLDYFTEMMLLADQEHGDARTWAQEQLRIVNGVVDALLRTWKQKEAEKWTYFRDQLAEAIETWPDNGS